MISKLLRWCVLTCVFSIQVTFIYAQCSAPVWADEFANAALDLSKWSYQTGNGCPNLCGWGNNELETYTSNSKNLYITNGNLVIEAVKENVNGSQFTSAKIITLGKFSKTYGRFEARMKMPLGFGMWPAFWMLADNNNWPMTGEIDIMEYRGDKPRETNATLHYGSQWPQNQWDGSTHVHSEDLSSAFHVYAVEWQQNELKFYFDDVLVKRETRNPNSLNPPSNGNAWPWTNNFYIILNLAVGGNYAGNPQVNQVQLTKPTFEIDYVRVYDLPCIMTGIQEENKTQNMTLYPQPVKDELFFHTEKEVLTEIVIKDLQGNTVFVTTALSTGKTDVSGLPKGMYLVEMKSDRKLKVLKMMKE